jgi:hypothetical protein
MQDGHSGEELASDGDGDVGLVLGPRTYLTTK